jgi:hypothetical protein
VTGAVKGQKHPQQTFVGFYRHIYDNRCRSNDDGWAVFRQELCSRLKTSCNQLRNEKVRELHAVSVSPLFRKSATPTPATSDSDGEPPSLSLVPALSHQQRHDDESPTTNGAVQSQQILRPLADPVAGPGTAVESHRYTSVLKEHSDIQGRKVCYQKTFLSFDPPSWHYRATLGDFSGEGVGRNLTQAKHAASKQLYGMIGLSIL